MRRRDRAAFDALYDRYADSLPAFGVRLTGNRADAEDLVQETFLAAYSGTTSFRGNSRLLTYLMGIPLRRHRDSRRRPRTPNLPLIEDTDSTNRGAQSPVENAVVAAMAFEQASAGLEEPLRVAFLLVASQGLTHRKAAHVLQIPLGTCKWRVAEATRRLRAALSETDDFTGEKERETNHEKRKLLEAL